LWRWLWWRSVQAVCVTYSSLESKKLLVYLFAEYVRDGLFCMQAASRSCCRLLYQNEMIGITSYPLPTHECNCLDTCSFLLRYCWLSQTQKITRIFVCRFHNNNDDNNNINNNNHNNNKPMTTLSTPILHRIHRDATATATTATTATTTTATTTTTAVTTTTTTQEAN
jgi:hypothetical protein